MKGLFDDFLGAAQTSGCADLERCDALLHEAADQQRSMVRDLLGAGILDETVFLQALAERLGLPWIPDADVVATSHLQEEFPARFALQHHLLPHALADDELVLLTYDPLDFVAVQMLRASLPRRFRFAMSTRRAILTALRTTYGIGAETFEALIAGRDGAEALSDHGEEINVLDEEDSEASVMKFVNQILREAIRERATDIHIEPLGSDLRIRYRVDGVLLETPVPAKIKLLQASVISRVKIMANLDIAERRVPQDGRINLELAGQAIDVRVATIPSVNGESVSLRLLGQELFTFERLGLDGESEKKLRALLAMPNGIVLVTGPTGCGKSTSLYTFLSSLNTKERRIITIEEPVEHRLDGVIQIAVKPEINLTFANALRSVLRGDPNVVMVGEMRDFETAEIAIRAALTGHLVFSTLHTNDAVGGISRLLDMGIEPFLVGSAVRAFLAQRLVRRLCPVCRVPASLEPAYLAQIGFPDAGDAVIFKPGGCEACRQTGYQGRMAIFEIVLVTPRMQELVHRRSSPAVLRALAMEEGMTPLRQHGWSKVLAGLTSIEEVLRVTVADVDVQDE